MQIIFQFNSQSRWKWIPEAIKIAEKKDSKLIGKYYQINFSSTKDKDLLKLDYLVNNVKGTKLFINGEEYGPRQATVIINSIFNCGFKYPYYQGVCSGKCVNDYNQEVKVLAERYCEILNPKLKNDFPESFSDIDYQNQLNSFEFNIEDLEWLDQIGLHNSTDKIDYFTIGESQKDAQIYEHNKQYEKALGKYVEILKLDHIGGHYFDWNMRHIGDQLIELNKDIQAIEVYKKYLEFFPDDEEISALLDDLNESIETKKSFSTIRANRLHKEEESVIEPIITEIDDSIKDKYLDFLHYRKSILEGNSFKRKLSLYKENVKEKPNTITAWRNLAYAYLAKNEYQNAIHCYETAIKLGTKAQDLWLWCADTYSESGNYVKAVELYRNMQDLIDLNYFDNYIFHIFYCFEKIATNQPYNEQLINGIINLYEQLLVKSESDKNLNKFNDLIHCCIKSVMGEKNLSDKSSSNEIKVEGNIEEEIISESDEWCLRGDALSRIGKYEEAIECYEKALDIDPEYKNAWVEKGRTLDILEKAEDAIKCFEKALELDPNDPNVWINKMNALNILENEEKSLECHRRVLEIDDDFYEKYFAQQEKLEDEVQTVEWYNKAFKFEPNDLNGLICKGLELGVLGKYEEAIECYEKVLGKNPDYKEALVNKGEALCILRNLEEAIECYSNAIEIDSKYIDAWLKKGGVLSLLGKYEEVIECYDKLLEIDPNYKDAWLNKGLALGSLEKYQEAIECYSRAIEIDPKYIDAWLKKGGVLGLLGKYEQALECFEKAIKIDPEDNKAWMHKGMALTSLEKDEDAIKCYDKALNINPRDEYAWYCKGMVFDQQRNYEMAIECYDQTLELNPWDIDAWYYKARDLEFSGKYNEAIKCYEKLLEIDPKDEDARLHKERVLDVLKNKQG